MRSTNTEYGDVLKDLRCLWVANEGAAEITANSIYSFLEVAPDLADRIYVGCIGTKTLDYFTDKIPHAHLIDLLSIPEWVDFVQIETEGDYGDYGTTRFRDVSFGRYFALMQLLEQSGTPILYMDGDIAFLDDPRPHLAFAAQKTGTVAVLQTDRRFEKQTLFDARGYAILKPGTKPNFCTGFMCWFDAMRLREICLRIIAGRDVKVDNIHDQQILNHLPFEDLQGLVPLPEEIFPNGSHLFAFEGGLGFPRAVVEERMAKACLVHANWMIGMETKVAAIKSVGLWNLPVDPTQPEKGDRQDGSWILRAFQNVLQRLR